MTPVEYAATQAKLIELGEEIQRLELDEMLKDIGRADSVGSILDPTLYRAAHVTMGCIRRLAKAGLDFQFEARRLKEQTIAKVRR